MMQRDDEHLTLSPLDRDLQSFVMALRDDLDERLARDGFANGHKESNASAALPLQALAKDDPELALFAGDLRSVLNERLVAPAGLTALVPRRSSRRSWQRYAGAGVTALAACLAIVVGVTRFRVHESAPFGDGSLAAQQLGREQSSTAVVPVQRNATARVQADESAETQNSVKDSSAPLDAGAPVLAPEVLAPRIHDVKKVDSETTNQRAREAWQAGDLGQASRLLRQIIAQNRGSEASQAAYADLFAIARQQGPGAKQAKIWRDYLREFPSGRYAQDARAGLCQVAQGGEALECWKEYLQHHPQGTHRASAEAALAAGR